MTKEDSKVSNHTPHTHRRADCESKGFVTNHEIVEV